MADFRVLGSPLAQLVVVAYVLCWLHKQGWDPQRRPRGCHGNCDSHQCWVTHRLCPHTSEALLALLCYFQIKIRINWALWPSLETKLPKPLTTFVNCQQHPWAAALQRQGSVSGASLWGQATAQTLPFLKQILPPLESGHCLLQSRLSTTTPENGVLMPSTSFEHLHFSLCNQASLAWTLLFPVYSWT